MSTRAELRRAVCGRLQMPYYRRFGLTSLTATGGSTTTLVDTTHLLQEDDFWSGDILYLPTDDEQRVISGFDQGTKTITFLEPLGSAIESSDEYEIMSLFAPSEVHRAINLALADAWPFFFTANEGYLVIQSGVGVEYDLSALSPTAKRIASVWLESIGTSETGQVTGAGTNVQLIDSAKTFTAADVGKQVRIYKGTSQGDYRTVSALVDSHTLQVSVAFTSSLDTTSCYRLVQLTDEDHYTPIMNWRADKIDNPTTLRLSAHPMAYEGYLMRIVYEAEHTELTTESGSTTCPHEYVELAALARLFLDRISGSPSERVGSWVAAQRSYAEAAAAFAKKHAQQHLPGQVLQGRLGGRVPPTDYPF